MEPHSTVETPQKESSNLLIHVLSSIIALATITLPLYIAAHYSSSPPANSLSTTTTVPASPLPRSILRVSEGAK